MNQQAFEKALVSLNPGSAMEANLLLVFQSWEKKVGIKRRDWRIIGMYRSQLYMITRGR